MEIIGIFGIAFVLLALIAWAAISRIERQQIEAEDGHTIGDHLDHLTDELCAVRNRLENLEGRVIPAIHRGGELKEQVDHLARVQLLILQDLKKEHQVQPQKDVLVTIEPLPRNRERSA